MQRFASIWVALLLCLHATGAAIPDKKINSRRDQALLVSSESISARTLTAFVGPLKSTMTEAEEDAPLPPDDDQIDDEDEQPYKIRKSAASSRRRPPPPKRKRSPSPMKRPPPPQKKSPPPTKRKPLPPPKMNPSPPPTKRKPPPPPKKSPSPPPPKRKPPPPPKKNPSPPPPKRKPPPPPKENPPTTNNGERPKAVSRSKMCQSRNLMSRGIVGGRRYGMKYYHACLNRVSKSMECCEQCRDAEGCQGWFFTRLDCSAFSASSNAGVCYLLSDALLAYENPGSWWNGGVQWTAEQTGWNLGSDWNGGSAVAMETGQEMDSFELSY